jgi:hypothetical protein
MNEPRHHRPIPARLSGGTPKGKPTPAREMAPPPAGPPLEADLAETQLELGETRWTVRVLGRAGRASGTTPPLLLLGFWEDESLDQPSLEVLVAAKSLRTLTTDRLQEAFARAVRPEDRGNESTFFAETGQNRRGERRRS